MDAESPSWTVDALPRLIDVVNHSIVCRGCRRRWKCPPDGRLSEANYEYLCQHADLHERERHKRPAQTWKPGIPSESLLIDQTPTIGAAYQPKPRGCTYCHHSQLKHRYQPSKGGASACSVRSCPCWEWRAPGP